MTIHNNNHSNREPIYNPRNQKDYIFGKCPNCGAPYAIEVGKEFDPKNCSSCAWAEKMLREAEPTTTEQDADAASEQPEELLGTHWGIVGGEMMELDGYLEARYDEMNGGDDLPF